MFIQSLFFLIAVVLSFLQATILPVNLLYLLVIFVTIYQPEFSFLFAFLAGLILDLSKGESLGISSLKFLVVALLSHLIKNRLPIGEKRQLKLPSV